MTSRNAGRRTVWYPAGRCLISLISIFNRLKMKVQQFSLAGDYDWISLMAYPMKEPSSLISWSAVSNRNQLSWHPKGKKKKSYKENEQLPSVIASFPWLMGTGCVLFRVPASDMANKRKHASHPWWPEQSSFPPEKGTGGLRRNNGTNSNYSSSLYSVNTLFSTSFSFVAIIDSLFFRESSAGNLVTFYKSFACVRNVWCQ